MKKMTHKTGGAAAVACSALLACIVDGIVTSLKTRYGLREMWKSIAPAMKKEIMDEWKLIIQGVLEAEQRSQSKSSPKNSTGIRKTCAQLRISARRPSVLKGLLLRRHPELKVCIRDKKTGLVVGQKATAPVAQSRKRDGTSRATQVQESPRSPSNVRRLSSRSYMQMGKQANEKGQAAPGRIGAKPDNEKDKL